nr:reverse transcriptase domain-containing protein [Tanacetum cinerariifolium]
MQKVLMERPQGVLLSNTIPNPREDIKFITTQSGVTLPRPSVPHPPLSSSKEVEQESKTTTDQVLTESTTRVPPTFTSSKLPPAYISSVVVPEQNPHQTPIPYPLRLNKGKLQDNLMPIYVPLILERHALRTTHALVDVHGEELTLRVGDEKLVLDDHFHEVLNVQKSINPLSGSPTPSHDPVIASVSPSLTPFEDIDFILKEIDTFLASDDSTSPDVDAETFDMEGDPPDLELKDLPHHLKYVFLEETSKLPVIIAKDLKREEKEQLLKVLKSHKRAIAWKISNIRGINPNFCTHKILMIDGFKLAIQHQRQSLGEPCLRRTQKEGTYLLSKMLSRDCSDGFSYSKNLISKFMIKKGAENLAADHLSRLENPHQGDLVDMEINDNFSHESLNIISLNLDNEPSWFADIALKGCHPSSKRYSLRMFDIIYGMTPISFRFVLIILFDGVWTNKKLWIFSRLATMVPPRDIMARTTLSRKFLTLVFSSPPYTAMPMTLSHTATHVNIREKYYKGTKCPNILFRFVRSLTSRASTLWARSRLYEGTDIYSWLSTIYLNGLKRRRSLLMMLELL